MFDSLEDLFNAADNVREEEYFYILDEWLEEYCDGIEWKWLEIPTKDWEFLNKNREWIEYLTDNFLGDWRVDNEN